MKNDEYMHTKTLVETSFYDSTNEVDIAIKKESKGDNYVKGKIVKVRSYNAVLSKHFNKNMYDIKVLAFIRPMIVGVKTTTEATKLISTESMTLNGEPFTLVQKDAEETKARFSKAWEEFVTIEENGKKLEEAEKAEKAEMKAKIAELEAKVSKETKEKINEVATFVEDEDDIVEEINEEAKPKKRMGRPKGS